MSRLPTRLLMRREDSPTVSGPNDLLAQKSQQPSPTPRCCHAVGLYRSRLYLSSECYPVERPEPIELAYCEPKSRVLLSLGVVLPTRTNTYR